MFQKDGIYWRRILDDNNLRIYGLDRLENFEETKEHFTMPKNFDANTYFSSGFYGIVTDETIPLQRIVVRANRQTSAYLFCHCILRRKRYLPVGLRRLRTDIATHL